MIYICYEIKKVKQDTEWIIHERKTITRPGTMHGNVTIIRLEQSLFAYDNLLKNMDVNGNVDTVKDDLKGIDVTADLIEKIKLGISGTRWTQLNARH
ncbi:MAG: hypothetical protein JO014_18065 [Metakosakonia sp.]|nr:hypothetical protein [Phytobacter sp.]MBV8874614.1 hypothetical protein [Phytobacter sp.]